MNTDLPETPRLKSEFKTIKRTDYDRSLGMLLSVQGHAELAGVFAYNVQNHPDGLYDKGPISLDPSLNTPQLYELGLISKNGEVITAFGKHVVKTVILDSAQLAEGRITPVIRPSDK